MAFGGIFGGSSSSSPSKDNDNSSSTTSIPNPMLSSSPSPSSSTTLQRIQSAITEQSNVTNAKVLISNVNTNCFDKCVPAPGSSLSSGEQKCISACMEKYIDAWNVTSRSYMARLQKESAQFPALGGAAGGAPGGGKELF